MTDRDKSDEETTEVWLLLPEILSSAQGDIVPDSRVILLLSCAVDVPILSVYIENSSICIFICIKYCHIVYFYYICIVGFINADCDDREE